MQHKIYEPDENLAFLVKNYWVLEGEKETTPKKNIIIPDGCMKMIFHYGDPYKHYHINGKIEILPRAFLIGQLTKPYEVEPSGETGTFFVCFHPNGFFPFTKIPVKKLENTAVSLEKIFGEEGQNIQDKILNTPNVLDKIKHIEKFLFQQLLETQSKDYIIESIVDTILSTNGNLSIEEISHKPNVSRRQLERKFSSTIGLSPKKLSKIIKLQNTLKKIINSEKINFTQIAHTNEYYDQAHFNKDFKQFTGFSPKELYGERLKMSMIFDKKDN